VLPCANKMSWYLLKLNSIRVPSRNMTHSGFSQCDECLPNNNCFTDSGASSISLPLPESQCKDILSGKFDVLQKESMLLDILGVNGTTITLSLPLLWLTEQIMFGNVVCTGAAGEFLLGFPIFQYYYLAYDMADNTITFVDLHLSDENEAFIDGPEHGGILPPSSGYHYYFSTTSSFMMAIGILLLALGTF